MTPVFVTGSYLPCTGCGLIRVGHQQTAIAKYRAGI